MRPTGIGGSFERVAKIGVLVAVFGLPWVSRALGTPVGAFSMFERLERYHLELEVLRPDGERMLPVRVLAPHLSRDARRIVLPGAHFSVGADQVPLLAGGLDDVARLVCELEPEAIRVTARLTRASLDRTRSTQLDAVRACKADR